jgi:hypothetical protein
MPWTTPRSLADDQVYALTAYILARNKLVDAKQVIDAQTLPKVQMPSSALLHDRMDSAEGHPSICIMTRSTNVGRSREAPQRTVPSRFSRARSMERGVKVTRGQVDKAGLLQIG